MATQAFFPMSMVCSVSVNEAPAVVSGPQFNQALVIGTSPVIPSYGSNARARQYTGTTAMLSDGFTQADPEYIWAVEYFSQTPTAPTYLWVGRLDLTAVQTAVPHTGEIGTGYAVGDTVTPTQAGLTNTIIQVATVGANGTVTGLSVVQGGTGAVVATALATTTSGSGTGLEIDITAVGETQVQAVTACRAVSPLWWAFAYPQGVAADHIALATWSAQSGQLSYYEYDTQDAAAIAGTPGNVFETLYAQKIGRNFGVHQTTQGGLYPNNIYQSAARCGQLMGRNTGLAGSAFSMFYKTLTGAAPDTPLTLTQTQLTTLTNEGGNAYIAFPTGNTVWPGVDPTGLTQDEQLFIDMLVSNIQYAVGDSFAAYPVIPQTDAGQQILIGDGTDECVNMQSIGFIAPSGVWTGSTDSFVTNGQSFPKGFKVFSPSFTTQSAANRSAHQMMPLYVYFIEAGSGRSIAVQINVQR